MWLRNLEPKFGFLTVNLLSLDLFSLLLSRTLAQLPQLRAQSLSFLSLYVLL